MPAMGKTRLEAFSDGVIAIIITIMVLELKVPHQATFAALVQRWPIFLSYLLSFVFVGIYWGNHHHLIHSVKRVSPGVIWANMHLLFWLSLVPFVTNWLGETRAQGVPTAVYGLVMIFTGLAYQILQTTISRQQTDDAGRHAHDRNSKKGLFCLFIYSAAIALSFAWPPASIILFVLVALLWLVPDSAFEKIQHQG